MSSNQLDKDIPIWDGSADAWEQFQTKLSWYLRRGKPHEESFLIARVIGKLTGKAWTIIEQVPENQRDKLCTKATFIKFLKKNLLDGAVPELGRKFKSWLNLRRSRKESMKLYIMRNRTALQKLEKSLKSVDNGTELGKLLNSELAKHLVTGKGKVTGSQAGSSVKSHRTWSGSQRPKPDEKKDGEKKDGKASGSKPEMFDFDELDKEDEEELEKGDDWEGYWKTSWWDSGWDKWEKKRKTTDDDDDTDDEDIEIPETETQQLVSTIGKIASEIGGKHPELEKLVGLIKLGWRASALPDLLTGWSLLKNSNLTPSERATILSAASAAANATGKASLKLEFIEKALSTQWQDDELMARDDKIPKSSKANSISDGEFDSADAEEPEAYHNDVNNGFENESEHSSGPETEEESAAILAALIDEDPDGEDTTALAAALQNVRDSKIAKKRANRTLAQARAIVSDIKKSRKFYPRGRNNANAMNYQKKSMNNRSFPKTFKSKPKRSPTPAAGRMSTPAGSGKGDVCFRCGKEGHVARNCTKPAVNSAAESADGNFLLTLMFHDRPS